MNSERKLVTYVKSLIDYMRNQKLKHRHQTHSQFFDVRLRPRTNAYPVLASEKSRIIIQHERTLRTLLLYLGCTAELTYLWELDTLQQVSPLLTNFCLHPRKLPPLLKTELVNFRQQMNAHH